MMKKLAAITLCLALCSQAHAGIWDSITDFFGGSDEAETTETAGAIEKSIELLPMLTQSLGITDNKALGGMGALLQAVKSLMSDGDYSSLLSAIPNASSFLDAAPEILASEKKDDALGSALAAAGELSDKAKSLSTLNSQFDSLGLDMDMAPKFVDTAKNYFNESGNDSASELLTSAIGKLF